MTKFKHKTSGAIVSAVQFEYGYQMPGLHYQDASNPRIPVVLETIDGQHLLRQGEWIVISGEKTLVPVEDKIFKEEYEPAP